MTDEFCCDAPKPEGFTYHPNVTVCDTCGTKFPYYDCYCELRHTCVASVRASIEWVVDMMNSGKVNLDDVYPRGRYQGD
jgi:hypothetical protein